jgi:hypothetical protein
MGIPPLLMVLLPSAATLVLLCPGLAAATQVHVPSEGLYAHQIGHVFFALSMAILIYWLRERRLVKERGWRLIQYAALFFILWNVDAFVVHYLDGRSDLFQIIDGGTWHASVHLTDASFTLGMIYYLFKLDHLLCVPAIVLLFLGLRNLLQHAREAKT